MICLPEIHLQRIIHRPEMLQIYLYKVANIDSGVVEIAHAFGMAKGTVSKRIKSLEKMFGEEFWKPIWKPEQPVNTGDTNMNGNRFENSSVSPDKKDPPTRS